MVALTTLSILPGLDRASCTTWGARSAEDLIDGAGSTETLLCSYLSAILLAGLVLNATVGWWWADPLAALGIAFLAAREGAEIWRGEDEPY
jgi:hypothetical protein